MVQRLLVTSEVCERLTFPDKFTGIDSNNIMCNKARFCRNIRPLYNQLPGLAGVSDNGGYKSLE